MLRLVRERTGIDPRGRAADADGAGAALAPAEIADICASFQRVVVDVLLDRTFEAAGWLGARSIGISGGVSANSHGVDLPASTHPDDHHLFWGNSRHR